jgi:5-methylthioadenosine/S-adenosylhomocysteine deaminase
MRTLFSGGTILTCDANHTIFSQGDLVIEADRIVYVGPAYGGTYDVRLPAVGRLILPGFVNAHTHAPMTLFRGLADDVNLQVFLAERVWPREIRMSPDDAYHGAVLAGIEMLRSGVTTYADMYFFPEELARAALDVGLRALVTPGIIDSPAWIPRFGTWEDFTQRALEFCTAWEGREGRIHTGLGPHSPYTLSLDALMRIRQVALEHDLPINIHILESPWEKDNPDVPDVERLADRGFFEGRTIAAHSVWVDAAGIETYARRGVGVAHCPQSNAKLGNGIAPVWAMLAAGVDVGLGTDGAATNNNLDLHEELRLAPLLQNVHSHDPTALSAGQALAMATRLGGRAIHLPDIGVLAEGYRADILVARTDDPAAVPLFDPSGYIGHVVYAMDRGCVDQVWVAGTRVVDGGEVLTVDVAQAMANVQRAALAVTARAAV